MLVRRIVTLTALATTIPSGAAWAQEAPATAEGTRRTGTVEGSILAIESGDIFLDLGQARGAETGKEVELWRPMKLKHPVTGATVVDRWRIGTLRLGQVRPQMSMGRVEGEIARPPAVGDVLVMRVLLTEPVKPESPPRPITPGGNRIPAPPLPPPSKPDPAITDALEVARMFSSLEGQGVQTRIAAYESFVASHPNGPYNKVLGEESSALRRLVDDRRQLDELQQTGAHATAGGTKAKREATLLGFNGPEDARAGEPVRVALELAPRFKGAVLHYRRRDAPTYVSTPMRGVGERYFAAEIPKEAVSEPGFDYFIEGVDRAGSAAALVGEPHAPRAVRAVQPDRSVRPPGRLVTANVSTDYASFNQKAANDYVWQTEGAFGLRLSDEGLRAIRSGFGVFRGLGGNVDELDGTNGVAPKPPREVGLTYGYVEMEYAFNTNYALVGRGAVGLREAGINGGAQAFLRIGNDRRSNLSLGGEILGGIGLRGIAQFELKTLSRVPLMLRTEVSNQPTGLGESSGGPFASPGAENVSARMIAQAGYQLTSSLTLSGRVSYQGRNINHAGPGAGAAVSYEW